MAYPFDRTRALPRTEVSGALSYYTGNVSRHSALMLSATAVSGAAGFFYKVLMSRMLCLGDFSAFYALLNFFTIFSVPALTVEIAVAKTTSRLRASGPAPGIPFFIGRTAARISLIALSGALLLAPAAVPASRLLRLSGPGPVLLVLSALALFLPLNVGYGAVQGLQKFKWWGGVLIAVSLSRLAAGTAFVRMGTGVSGAVGASFAAIGLGIILMTVPLGFFRKREPAARSCPAGIPGLAWIFAPLLLITYLAFADMLFVKHFFPPHVSAVYGASSILGRAVFYTALPVSMAMFPKVCFAGACGVRAGFILFRGVAVFLMISLPLAAILFFAPEFAARLLFSEAYAGAGRLIKYAGFAFLPAGLCLLLVQYNLALNRRGFIPCLCVAAAGHFILLLSFNASPGQVLASVAASGTAAAVLTACCSGSRGASLEPVTVEKTPAASIPA